MLASPLDVLPVWAFFFLTCLLIALPLEIGFRLGRRHRRRFAEDKESSVGVAVGSILALLAFMLAFTFGLAAPRYEERRRVVLEEANAIGTTYLRTRLLPEPPRQEIADLLRRYVDVRLQTARPEASPADFERTMTLLEQMQADIWGKTMEVADQNPSLMTGLFIQTLNDMIDVHGKRVLIVLRNRIPGTIWVALFVVGMVAFASAGYQSGFTATRRTIVMIGLVVAFAGVVTLIADLDNPRKGFLRNTQAPLIDLQRSIQAR